MIEGFCGRCSFEFGGNLVSYKKDATATFVRQANELLLVDVLRQPDYRWMREDSHQLTVPFCNRT